MAGQAEDALVPGCDPDSWPRVVAPASRLALLRAVDEAGNELSRAVAVLRACGVAHGLAYPVGVIDRLLLRAHRVVLCRDLEAVAVCPACRLGNALPLGADDVPTYAPRSAWCDAGLGMREPTGADLAALPGDAEDAALELERRCRVGQAEGLPPAGALDRADQSLCGMVHVACVGCGGPVSVFVDVQQLVVAAITDAVADVDVEVHLIAARYGWDLATIESLSDARRQRLATLAADGPRTIAARREIPA